MKDLYNPFHVWFNSEFRLIGLSYIKMIPILTLKVQQNFNFFD